MYGNGLEFARPAEPSDLDTSLRSASFRDETPFQRESIGKQFYAIDKPDGDNGFRGRHRGSTRTTTVDPPGKRRRPDRPLSHSPPMPPMPPMPPKPMPRRCCSVPAFSSAS